MAKLWKCTRVTEGMKCGWSNAPRTRKCFSCGKPKPPKRSPKHMAALKADYEAFVKLNGGDFCAICKRKPSDRRRLDRDHCHKTGEARGLLCSRCNRALPSWVTAEWLREAAEYIKRSN